MLTVIIFWWYFFSSSCIWRRASDTIRMHRLHVRNGSENEVWECVPYKWAYRWFSFWVTGPLLHCWGTRGSDTPLLMPYLRCQLGCGFAADLRDLELLPECFSNLSLSLFVQVKCIPWTKYFPLVPFIHFTLKQFHASFLLRLNAVSE